MVAREGRYYVSHSKGHIGVTKGDPTSPTIFNMVGDVAIGYWVLLMAGEEAGPDRFRQAVQWLV